MASNKTPNLGLDVWAEMDYFKRAELNGNFNKLDEKISDISTSSGIELRDLPDYVGVNYFGDNIPGAFAGVRATNALDIVSSVGMNMVVINNTNYMATYTSNDFTGQVQPNSDILDFCTKSTNRNLMIVFKPLVQVADGTWRANIYPSNVTTWFANYKAWILDQAALAQSVKAEVFCIGTELRSMSGWEYRTYWVDLIASIRSIFKGKLTYGANGPGSNEKDEIFTFCFVDLLDYAGIDLYPRLTSKDYPTTSEMVDAWYNSASGYNWLFVLEKWQATHNKPVILTEIGCTGIVGANKSPGTTFHGTVNIQEQANFITAMFNVLKKRCTWLKGVWWWDISANPADAYSFEQEPSFTAMKTALTSNYKGGDN